MNKKIKGYERFEYNQEQRNELIEKATVKFGEFLDVLGFDWKNDPNMDNTPKRVAKAYINELFIGNYSSDPDITTFSDGDNPTEYYDGVVIQKNISFNSTCSHHFLPFMGKCHIGYLTPEDGEIIGLSKLNRIAQYCASRPQNQERLTQQIVNKLKEYLKDARGIIVVIEATHNCVSCRGVRDLNSSMVTVAVEGEFKTDKSLKTEFLHLIKG